MNNLIAWDQAINALWAGSPDETVSSRLGRLKKHFSGKIPFLKRPIPRIGSELLNMVDKNHCENAIEKDEFEQIIKESIFDGNKATKE
jgi:hypothetical protein